MDIQAFNPGAISEEERVALRAELGVPERSPVVTMASRLLWDKGVAEYVEAAPDAENQLGQTRASCWQGRPIRATLELYRTRMWFSCDRKAGSAL